MADDHPVNREVLVRQLELLGHRCRYRQRWRGGARSLVGCRRPLRGGARRHPHAAHGRARVDAPDPRRRGKARDISRAHADRRGHRQCDEGRGRALSRRRHGRVSGKAGEHGPVAHHARALDADRRFRARPLRCG